MRRPVLVMEDPRAQVEIDLRGLLIEYLNGLDLLDDRYERPRAIDENGGRGTFSVVFRAFDRIASCDVVLKFFDPAKNHEHYRRLCFEREAQAMTELTALRNHRHVAEIIEGVQTHSARFPAGADRFLTYPVSYITLTPYERSLFEFIYEGTSSIRETLAVFRQILIGVRRVHACGYCHRDLKPDNVLLDEHGDAFVSDFGTAKRYQLVPEQVGYAAGELRYSSPEVLAGLTSPSHLVSTDVFALGSLLYEIINRRRLDAEYEGFKYLWIHLPLIQAGSYDERSRKLAEIVRAVEGVLPRPSLFSDSAEIPPALRWHGERLFQGLSELDYQRRIKNLDHVLLQTDICLKVLGIKKLRREHRY